MMVLSPEAAVALKKYNTEAINKLAKKTGIHVTDIADQEPLPSEDTTPEEPHHPHQFIDYAPDNAIKNQAGKESQKVYVWISHP